MNNDVRTSKNIKEKPVDKMLKEFRKNQKRDIEIDKSHARALKEEERQQRKKERQHYRQFRISELQKKQQEIKEREKLKKLQKETSISNRIIKQLKEEKRSLSKKPRKYSTVKPTKHKKYVVINGIAYPVASTSYKQHKKKKKTSKKDEITL